MSNVLKHCRYYAICIILLAMSCTNRNKSEDKNMVTNARDMNDEVADQIKTVLKTAVGNSGKINDSMVLKLPQIVDDFYIKNEHEPVWSSAEKWLPMADSLFNFIKYAENEGLFPNDYHQHILRVLKDTLGRDSLARMNVNFWTHADLLLTDGFMHIIKDLKLGRLQPDSVSLNADSVLIDKFFITLLNNLIEKKDFGGLLISLQPKHKNYWELKKGIKKFVDSMDRRVFTHVTYPFKKNDAKDSLYFIKLDRKSVV